MRGQWSWRVCSKRQMWGQGTGIRPCPGDPAWDTAVTQARAAGASWAAVMCHMDLRDATREVTQEKSRLGAASQ